jgi:hypothetical protein
MHTRKNTVIKSRTNRSTEYSIRRDGLRSGGQLPPGSEAGLKSERVLKQPEQQQQSRLKPVVKKKAGKLSPSMTLPVVVLCISCSVLQLVGIPYCIRLDPAGRKIVLT